jgi:hypothetical protein
MQTNLTVYVALSGAVNGLMGKMLTLTEYKLENYAALIESIGLKAFFVMRFGVCPPP